MQICAKQHDWSNKKRQYKISLRCQHLACDEKLEPTDEKKTAPVEEVVKLKLA